MDYHIEFGGGGKAMFRMSSAHSGGGYSVDNGGSRFHTGPSVYPSDHPVTHNAEIQRQVASSKVALRNNAESLDVALRQNEYDSARQIHATIGRHLDEIESAQSRMVEW